MTVVFLRRLGLPIVLVLSAFAARADVLDHILESGTITVGVADFTPWTMHSESGELIGSEIDVARKLAEDMGVSVEFKMLDWPDLIPAARSGEIDLIAAGMSITPARALEVNFTQPVASAGIVLTTNTEMTRNVASLADLNSPEVTIAVAKETLSHSVAGVLFDKAKLKIVSTPAKAGQEVVAGDAHAMVSGAVEARFLALRHGDVVDIPLADPLVGYSEAMAVKKGEQEMLNFLNTWIEARSADKWIETTRNYWFETMEWASEVKE